MAKLENFWIDTVNREIRLDWDNDRHQAVKIKSLESNEILYSLEALCVELEIEIGSGEI